MKERYVGPNGRQQHDRIVLAEGIVDDPPIRAHFEQVRTDDAAQRREGASHLRRAERRVNRGTCRILDDDRTACGRGGKTRRLPQLAETHGGSLHRGDCASADQQVGLERRRWQCHEMQSLDPAADECPRCRHGDARVVRGNGQHRAVGDFSNRCLELTQLAHAFLLLLAANKARAFELDKGPTERP